MKQDAFLDAIKVLGETGAPRVWSLIVTVFGDLARRNGDAISGPVLAEILTPIGVRPEAMRVALHRLRNEGWIETRKRGREALHHLSASGLEQSATASQRIYARTFPAHPEWHALFFPATLSGQEQSRATVFQENGYVTLSQGVYLANGPLQSPPPGALVLQGSIAEVPDWLGAGLVTQSQISAFKDLSAALQEISVSNMLQNELSTVQIATLRSLIVHRWRKLVLKLPAVPDAVFGADFEGIVCREHVISALDQLPRPDLADLGQIL